MPPLVLAVPPPPPLRSAPPLAVGRSLQQCEAVVLQCNDARKTPPLHYNVTTVGKVRDYLINFVVAFGGQQFDQLLFTALRKNVQRWQIAFTILDKIGIVDFQHCSDASGINYALFQYQCNVVGMLPYTNAIFDELAIVI